MKQTRNQTFAEELIKSEQPNRQSPVSALFNASVGANGAIHLQTLNGIMSLQANRRDALPVLGGGSRVIKLAVGVAALTNSADRLYNISQSSSANQVNTTLIERAADLTGASLSAAGALVNMFEGSSGCYIYDLFPNQLKPIVTAVYGLAGSVGVADAARIIPQGVDAKANQE